MVDSNKFRHTAKILTKEEVEKNRSNAYEYLDFNKLTKEQVGANRPKSFKYTFK